MKRELTCIVCPIGCQLSVTLENGVVTEVTGNTCPRGKQYATDECVSPVRTITTTARTADGGVIPIKTDRPISKEMMFACMEKINHATVSLPAHIGDVVIENLLGTGANVVVTANME
jgi:CxxC motif-containing protein